MQTFVFYSDLTLLGFETEPGLSSWNLCTLDRDMVALIRDSCDSLDWHEILFINLVNGCHLLTLGCSRDHYPALQVFLLFPFLPAEISWLG